VSWHFATGWSGSDRPTRDRGKTGQRLLCNWDRVRGEPLRDNRVYMMVMATATVLVGSVTDVARRITEAGSGTVDGAV
jgi:hypothetical protein